MKEEKEIWVLTLTLKFLYIPHGSDESSENGSVAVRMENFISHMVQMKGVWTKKSWNNIVTLYPTWFRWK